MYSIWGVSYAIYISLMISKLLCTKGCLQNQPFPPNTDITKSACPTLLLDEATDVWRKVHTDSLPSTLKAQSNFVAKLYDGDQNSWFWAIFQKW